MMRSYAPGFVCSEQQLAIISTILAARSLDEYIAYERGNRGFKPPSDPNLLHQFQPTLIELISTVSPQRELSHMMEAGGYDPKVIAHYFQPPSQRPKNVQDKDGNVDRADRIAGLLKQITAGLNTAYDLYQANYKKLNMDARKNNPDEHWMVQVFEATDWENLSLPAPDEHIRKAICVYDGIIKQFDRPSIKEDAFKKKHIASFMNLEP